MGNYCLDHLGEKISVEDGDEEAKYYLKESSHAVEEARGRVYIPL
jgi:hypothetical protein